ncbi:hypothetical protein [Halomarina litorea]|nr:hypothetical protein [Halomarina sp. BCD28]
MPYSSPVGEITSSALGGSALPTDATLARPESDAETRTTTGRGR